MTMGSLFADSLHLLVPLPVSLPLSAAGVKLALGGPRPKLQQAVSLTTLTVVLIVGALLMVGSQRYGPQAVQIGGWGTPIGITVVAGQLAARKVTVSAAINLAVVIYSIGQGRAGKAEVAPSSVCESTELILDSGRS